MADWCNVNIYDDSNHLVPEAEPYTPSSTLRKLNHPLMIMVKEERVVSFPVSCLACIHNGADMFREFDFSFGNEDSGTRLAPSLRHLNVGNFVT